MNPLHNLRIIRPTVSLHLMGSNTYKYDITSFFPNHPNLNHISFCSEKLIELKLLTSFMNSMINQSPFINSKSNIKDILPLLKLHNEEVGSILHLLILFKYKEADSAIKGNITKNLKLLETRIKKEYDSTENHSILDIFKAVNSNKQSFQQLDYDLEYGRIAVIFSQTSFQQPVSTDPSSSSQTHLSQRTVTHNIQQALESFYKTFFINPSLIDRDVFLSQRAEFDFVFHGTSIPKDTLLCHKVAEYYLKLLKSRIARSRDQQKAIILIIYQIVRIACHQLRQGGQEFLNFFSSKAEEMSITNWTPFLFNHRCSVIKELLERLVDTPFEKIKQVFIDNLDWAVICSENFSHFHKFAKLIGDKYGRLNHPCKKHFEEFCRFCIDGVNDQTYGESLRKILFKKNEQGLTFIEVYSQAQNPPQHNFSTVQPVTAAPLNASTPQKGFYPIASLQHPPIHVQQYSYQNALQPPKSPASLSTHSLTANGPSTFDPILVENAVSSSNSEIQGDDNSAESRKRKWESLSDPKDSFLDFIPNDDKSFNNIVDQILSISTSTTQSSIDSYPHDSYPQLGSIEAPTDQVIDMYDPFLNQMIDTAFASASTTTSTFQSPSTQDPAKQPKPGSRKYPRTRKPPANKLSVNIDDAIFVSSSSNNPPAMNQNSSQSHHNTISTPTRVNSQSDKSQKTSEQKRTNQPKVTDKAKEQYSDSLKHRTIDAVIQQISERTKLTLDEIKGLKGSELKNAHIKYRNHEDWHVPLLFLMLFRKKQAEKFIKSSQK